MTLRADRAPRTVFGSTFGAFAAALCGFVLPIAGILGADSLLKRLTLAEFGTAYLVAGAAWILLALLLASLASVLSRLEFVRRLVLPLVSASVLSILVVSGIYAIRMWITGQTAAVQGFPMWGSAVGLVIASGFLIAAFTRRGGSWLEDRLLPLQRTLRAPAILLAITALAAIFFGGAKPKDAGSVESAAASPPASSVSAVAGSRRPDIFLITIDTLAARDMSLYGYSRETTPHFERHADRFTVFDRFYANCNFTTCGVASLLSGQRPWNHRVQHLQGFFRDEEKKSNLATLLDKAGYNMASFVANPYAQPRQLGAVEAFDHAPSDYLGYLRTRTHDALAHLGGLRAHDALYLFPFITIPTVSDRLLLKHVDDWQPQAPDQQVHDALRFVDEAGREGRPLFVWLHLYPPHHPYLPPRPFRYRFNPGDEADEGSEQQFTSGFFSPDMTTYVRNLRARYNENVAYADDALGEYLDALRKRGKLDDSVVVVTADHGESFERGYLGHGGPLLHEPLIHIPFMIHVPGQKHGDRRSQPAEQVDVMPTLLELANVRSPIPLEGQSVVPLLRNPALASKPVYSMTLEESTSFGAVSRATVAMIDGNYKYVRHFETPEHSDGLYHLGADPLEQRDLRRSDAARAAAMKGSIDEQLRKMISGGS